MFIVVPYNNKHHEPHETQAGKQAAEGVNTHEIVAGGSFAQRHTAKPGPRAGQSESQSLTLLHQSR